MPTARSPSSWLSWRSQDQTRKGSARSPTIMLKEAAPAL
jgi:hypothetical protein